MRRFGEKLRAARIKAGLTQEEAAGQRMATRTLQRLEDGDGNPTLSTINELAAALHISVTDLIGEKPGKHPKQSLPEIDWAESARILHALSVAEPLRRLSALYLLTKDESYLDQLRALPHGSQFAQVLRKVL